MNDHFDDHLRDRLDSLGADVSNVRLPGPTAARRRATQRTRNQITGGVLAGIAVVALGVAGISQDRLFTAPEPAGPTDADSPTALPSPPDDPDDTGEPLPVPEVDTSIPDDAFMTTEDVQGESDAAWSVNEAPFEHTFACMPVPDDVGWVHYINQDARFHQFIERTDDPVGRFSQLRAAVEECVKDVNADDEFPFSQVWSVDGLGDEAWMATYFEPPQVPDEFGQENIVRVRILRVDEYVTVTVDGGLGSDDNLDMETDRSVRAAERLCAAISHECVGDVQAQRIDREPVGDIAGWPTIEEVAGITGLEIAEGAEPLSADEFGPGGWPFAYVPLDPVADGAMLFLTRNYAGADAEASVDVTVATFPDEGAARQHYEEMVATASAHDEAGVQADQTGTFDGGSHAFTTWRTDDPDIGISFVFGVIVQGGHVTLITHAIAEHEDRDLTADQLAELLVVAAANLQSTEGMSALGTGRAE